MFSGRSKGELRQALPPPEQPPNEASAQAPGHAVGETAPTSNATPDETRR
jgi:hypothetical protein